MTQQQYKLLEMLAELHSICEENEISYYLVGNALLCAARDKTFHGYEADIAMFSKDWKRLKEIYKREKPEIEIETIRDGGNLPGVFSRIVDKNTTMLDLDYYGVYGKPGIGIKVHILRTQRRKTTLLNKFENGLTTDGKGGKGRKYLELKALKVIKKSSWRDYLASLEEEVRANGPNRATFLKIPGVLNREFPQDYWNDRIKIRLEHVVLYTTKRFRDLLVKSYGKKWKTRNVNIPLESYRCIFSTVLPYEKYMSHLRETNAINEDFLFRLNRYTKEHELFDKMTDAEELGWDKTIFLAGERIRLWKKYMPIKEHVMELFNTEHYDEVEMILADYTQVLRHYLPMKIAVCFDQDYFEMQKTLFCINNKDVLATRMDKFVLEEDLLPIDLN